MVLGSLNAKRPMSMETQLFTALYISWPFI